MFVDILISRFITYHKSFFSESAAWVQNNASNKPDNRRSQELWRVPYVSDIQTKTNIQLHCRIYLMFVVHT